MTVDSFEEGRATGEPVELFLFRHGGDNDAVQGFTNHSQEISYLGIIFQPVPISRSETKSSHTFKRDELYVKTTTDNSVVQMFYTQGVNSVTTVTIFRGHVGNVDGDYESIFVGRISQCHTETSDGVSHAVMTALPTSSVLRRPGLTTNYQTSCPHMLFDADTCKASKAAATITTTVSSLTYTTVTLPGGWNGVLAAAKFTNGLFKWVGASGPVYRTILKIAGNVLTLSGPTTGLTLGGSVDLSLWCNRSMDDCENLHYNILNYGGCPHIPLANPINKI